jgi:hypothetical protein
MNLDPTGGLGTNGATGALLLPTEVYVHQILLVAIRDCK